MQTKNTASGTKYLELLQIMMAMYCSLLVIIGFMTVFNTVTHGWTGVIPFVFVVAGLVYLGNQFGQDKWSLREIPGSYFALSLLVGLGMGLVGYMVKSLMS